MAWEKRREHLRPEQRSHYVISDGGDQPNVVPSVASVWYYFREQTFDGIQNSYAIGNRIADAAAVMTDTTVQRRVLGSAAPVHLNKPMAEAANRNIQAIGLPAWSADEQAFAKAVQRNVGAKEDGLAIKLAGLRAPPPEPPSGGSDDIGDVSWTVPTIVVGYPANIPGLPGHHWANAIAMATPIAHQGVVAGSKVVAMTVLDLLVNEKLRDSALEYFKEVQTRDQQYVPMLGVEDRPAIELNADTMARYRDQLKKYYYDASRYETYLDQLGIKFPTLVKE
jgi:aminobenzoyl-glutamate utilization protein B